MSLALMYREELKEYDFGPGHPLQGDRFQLFPPFLREHLPEDDNYRFHTAGPATDEDLLLICHQEYIDFTREYFKAAHMGREPSHPERFSRYHSLDNLPQGRPGEVEEAARLILGHAKAAADLIQAGTYQKVVNFGGMHHAKPDHGEGFCIYNDVAFVARYLMKQHGLERILILDTDAHAGNGTAEYFNHDPKVLFIDLHQDPHTLYPGTGFIYQIGSGEGKGFTVNIPMPVYAGHDSYKLAFEAIIEPITADFKPQIIIRNGGSDPHFVDELTNLGLPVKGFEMIGEKVRTLAEVCQGRVIDIIGSGYNKEVLPYAWLALISGLADFHLNLAEPVPTPPRFQTDMVIEETRKVIGEVKKHLKDYWGCL
jgi:acetoin utilization protein AcuC